MIKIVHVISSLSTGGSEKMLLRILSRMDRTRFENIVVSLTGMGTLGCKLKAQGIPVYSLWEKGKDRGDSISFWRFLYLLLIKFWSLVRFLQKERPHILQTWLYHSDFIGFLAGKLSRVPRVVWNIRCANLATLRKTQLRLLGWFSPLVWGIIVNSFSGKQFHERVGYHPKRWVEIPNGFDLSEFYFDQDAGRRVRRDIGIRFEDLLIGFIGRDDPVKDKETFLDAAHLLCRKIERVHFLMVGKGMEDGNQALLGKIKDLGIGQVVHLLGERTDVPAIASALDLGTSSSIGEGFSNTVGEMMACSVPCVVTDAGDSAYVVGNTGRVVPPRNPVELSNAWMEVLSMNPAERRVLGKSAYQRIKEHFNLPLILHQYETLYEEIYLES